MQAKGPNALNMNAYVNGDDSEAEYADEGTSSRPNIDNAAIEQQFDAFVKDMQKYDRILSDVAKHIEEIDGDGEFITDFYPKYPLPHAGSSPRPPTKRTTRSASSPILTPTSPR